ncbi:hypothetical protein WI81_21900 [Burkholderia ubonensis]|nr:hypothetical protein WI81_21900 [Burkholderia ubonensis]
MADAGVTASSIYIEARDGVLVKWIVNANADDAGRLDHLMIKCTDRAAVVSHMNHVSTSIRAMRTAGVWRPFVRTDS